MTLKFRSKRTRQRMIAGRLSERHGFESAMRQRTQRTRTFTSVSDCDSKCRRTFARIARQCKTPSERVFAGAVAIRGVGRVFSLLESATARGKKNPKPQTPEKNREKPIRWLRNNHHPQITASWSGCDASWLMQETRIFSTNGLQFDLESKRLRDRDVVGQSHRGNPAR